MVRGKAEKTTGLLIAGFILACSFIYIPDWNVVGISKGCGILPRSGYSFFHTSVLHAVVNAWCLVSILFLYNVTWVRLVLSYMIAVVAPDFVLSSTPTVGLSAVCYVLLGSIAFQVKRKLYYNVCMIVYLLMGFIFPLVNGWLHLYSYVAGLFVGFLNMPIQCKVK